jgi:hypothetical protein
MAARVGSLTQFASAAHYSFASSASAHYSAAASSAMDLSAIDVSGVEGLEQDTHSSASALPSEHIPPSVLAELKLLREVNALYQSRANGNRNKFSQSGHTAAACPRMD